MTKESLNSKKIIKKIEEKSKDIKRFLRNWVRLELPQACI